MGKGIQVSFWREKGLPHRSFVDTFRMGFGLIANIQRQVFGGTIESQKRAGEQPADCRRSVDVYWDELPLATNERILWLNAIEGHMKKRRSHVKSDYNLNVCGLHFIDDVYMSVSKRLRKLAVPNIFNASAPVFTLKVVYKPDKRIYRPPLYHLQVCRASTAFCHWPW